MFEAWFDVIYFTQGGLALRAVQAPVRRTVCRSGSASSATAQRAEAESTCSV